MGLRLRLTARLVELAARRTVRSMAAEFGPPPAVVFAAELEGLSARDIIRGPQRLSPGWTAKVASRAPAPTG